MKYKKVLSGVLVAGLIISNAGAFASEGIVKEVREYSGSQMAAEQKGNLSQEEAEKLLKKHIKNFYSINIDEGNEGMNTWTEFREDPYSQKSTWQLSLSKHSNDKYLSIYATIDDQTGELMSISKYEDGNREAGKITKYTFEEAKAIASTFLKKHNPNLSGKVSSEVKQESYYPYYGVSEGQGLHPRQYRVFFERQHEGIPFMNDGVIIGVNSATGEVDSYEYRWSSLSLPSKDGVITTLEAEKSFIEALDFKLQYVPVTKTGGYYGEPIKEAKLAYAPHFQQGSLVDAKNGSMINPYQSETGETKKVDVTATEKKNFQVLNKEKKIRQKEISKDEAIKIAKETLKGIYGEVNIGSTNYYSNSYNNEKTWNIQFTIGEDRFNQGNISINAMTEEITNINNYNWAYRDMIMMGQEEFKSVIEWEEAYKKAIEIIKKLYPDKLKNIKTEQNFTESYYYYNDIKMPNPEYYFSFNRLENDIDFFYNNIHISFDRTTGLLQNLSFRWDDVQLPKPQGLIAKDKAINLFMEQTKMELAYSLIPQYPYDTKDQVIKLVYRNLPKNEFLYQSIDAKNGKFLDYRGQEIKEEKQNLQSVEALLKGHWGERELTIMHDNGIIDLQNFNLKEAVPKKEVLRMIIKSIGFWMDPSEAQIELKFTDINENDPYYEDMKRGVKQGIIENEAVAFKGDEPVTREELAVMLVKMARLDKLAKMHEIFTLPVNDMADINPDYLGYTALAYGFEVITGAGENYNPKEAVTLEQAAVAIYRNFNNLLYSIR